MYRLIVSDMDGTLLNSAGEIPEENIKVIKKAMDSGIYFAIVTGRPYVSVKGILKSNDLVCSVIGCNGAQVTDEDGKIVKAHYINDESLLRILKICEDKNIYYQIYDDNFIYTKSRVQLLKILKGYSSKAVKHQLSLRRIFRGIRRLFFTEVRVREDLIGFAMKKPGGFYKVQIASQYQKKLNSIGEELKDVPDINITSSSYYNIEIGPANVTKGTALKELAEIKGIPREEIIALGDNHNDIPMIEYAGCGVAMGNAEEVVKDKADFLTKTNDENGVAYAIEELVFRIDSH